MQASASILATLTALAGAVLIDATVARAEGPSDAEVLFREARTLAQAGNWALACPKFAESERLDPAPGTLLNLADCEEHYGTLVKAREHFRLAAAAFRQADKGRTVALNRAAGLQKRIAHLTLRLAPSVPPAAAVTLDGTAIDSATLGSVVDADPGSHEIVVSVRGHEDRKYSVPLADGATFEQMLDVGPLIPEPTLVVVPPTPPAAPPLPPPPSPPPPSQRGPVGLVLGGAGLASVIAGIATGVVAFSDTKTAKNECRDATRTCSLDGHNAAVHAQTFATVSDVTFIAGGVLVAAGAALWFTRPKEGAPPPIAFVPIVSPAGFGAVIERSF